MKRLYCSAAAARQRVWHTVRAELCVADV